jgi:RimJ/RimL family protein N-acetyltransferase
MKSYEESRSFAGKAMKFFDVTKLIGAFPIFIKDPSIMIGICGLKYAKLDDEPSEKIEIMYRLAKPYWGKWYATQAGQILLKYAFKRINLNQVIGFILAENDRSCAVLERLGMKFVRISSISNQPVELYDISAENYLGASERTS